MDIADIYDKFDQIGCLTFATIDKDTLQTRIAHLFAHDHEGLKTLIGFSRKWGHRFMGAV